MNSKKSKKKSNDALNKFGTAFDIVFGQPMLGLPGLIDIIPAIVDAAKESHSTTTHANKSISSTAKMTHNLTKGPSVNHDYGTLFNGIMNMNHDHDQTLDTLGTLAKGAHHVAKHGFFINKAVSMFANNHETVSAGAKAGASITHALFQLVAH